MGATDVFHRAIISAHGAESSFAVDESYLLTLWSATQMVFKVLALPETPKDKDTRNQLRPHLRCHRRELLLVFFL